MQLSTRMVWLRTYLNVRQSSLRTRRLRCHEGGGGLGRATTSLLLLRSLQIKSLDRLLNQSVRGNHFYILNLYWLFMLILTVVHICLAAHRRTPRSVARAIKGRSMVS
jgi:hypothetical protein